jgi:hypothetical protein
MLRIGGNSLPWLNSERSVGTAVDITRASSTMR